MADNADRPRNFCPDRDICHRELWSRTAGKVELKTYYSIEDAWEYLWIGILGRNHPIGLKSSVTKEELDRVKRQLIAQIRPMTTAEAEYLYSICNRYGLQTVLFAIDIYCMDDDIDEFFPDQLGRCLRQGQVQVASALFKYNHPEVH